jgi:hypothetical protein
VCEGLAKDTRLSPQFIRHLTNILETYFLQDRGVCWSGLTRAFLCLCMIFAYYCRTRSQVQHPPSQMKIALITQLTENYELFGHLAIHLWHLAKWTGSSAKKIFRSWGSHKCHCKKGVTDTWSTPEVKLNKKSPFSSKSFSSVSPYNSLPCRPTLLTCKSHQ